MKPRISVVIPAYNAEPWIRETVGSVFAQRYPDIELIVVDDCSTDRTGEILEELRAGAPSHITSFVLAKNEQNSRECRTSRKGFALATGEYICRLSADDLFVSPDHLERQLDVLEKTGADWCYNSVNTAGETPAAANVVRSSWFPVPAWFPQGTFQFLDNAILAHPFLAFLIILFRNPVNSSTFMIKAMSYRNTAQWSDRHWTDCDSVLLMSLLLKKSKGRAVCTIGAFYRVHPGQGSRNPEYLKEVARIRREMVRSVQDGTYPWWLKMAGRFVIRLKYPE